MHTINSQKGFTLIEAIIYIALFTFIIGGGVISAYQIFAGSAQIRMIAERETEINFMLRKLDWVLRGADILQPTAGFTDDELIVNKDGIPYKIRVQGNQLVMVRGSLTPESAYTFAITNTFVDVSGVSFTRSSGNPEILTAAFTVDGEVIGPITHYVRQD